MSNWATTLGSFFGENSWQFLAIAFVFGLIAVLKNLTELIWNQQDRKISHLKKALDIEGVSDEVKYVLIEDINRSLFMKVTGVAGDKYIREIYTELLRRSEGTLTINQLRRASWYLEFEDKRIVVPKTYMRRIGYQFDKWYPLFMCFTVIIQVITMAVIYTPELLFAQLLLVIGSLILALILYRQAVIYELALDVEKISKDLQ